MFMGRIHPGQVWVAFCSFLNHFCPQMVSVGPIWARLGPGWRPMVPSRKLAVSRAGQTESWFRGHRVPLPTPSFGGYHASEWAKRTPRRGSLPARCLFGCVLVCFGPRMPDQTGVKNGSKIGQTIYDHGPPGVPADVFLACFEACLGRFHHP